MEIFQRESALRIFFLPYINCFLFESFLPSFFSKKRKARPRSNRLCALRMQVLKNLTKIFKKGKNRNVTVKAITFSALIKDLDI